MSIRNAYYIIATVDFIPTLDSYKNKYPPKKRDSKGTASLWQG